MGDFPKSGHIFVTGIAKQVFPIYVQFMIINFKLRTVIALNLYGSEYQYRLVCDLNVRFVSALKQIHRIG